MKSKLSSLLAVLTLGSTLGLASLSAQAEDAPPPPPPPPPPHGERGEQGPKMPNAAKRLEHMAQQLGLSAEQKEQIKAVFQEEADAIRALRESEKASREQMKELRKSIRTKLEAILTPEQQAKFKEIHKDRPGRDGDRPNRRERKERE